MITNSLASDYATNLKVFAKFILTLFIIKSFITPAIIMSKHVMS